MARRGPPAGVGTAQQVEMQRALARGGVLVLMRARMDVRMHMHVQQR